MGSEGFNFKEVTAVFFFAFIGFDPCFTIWVYHRIFADVVQLITFANLPLKY